MEGWDWKCMTGRGTIFSQKLTRPIGPWKSPRSPPVDIVHCQWTTCKCTIFVRWCLVLSFFGTFGCTPSSTPGPALFVDASGSDDNPGTQDAPFATLQKARDAVRAINSSMTSDINVYIRGG